jgi:hypothetical protein
MDAMLVIEAEEGELMTIVVNRTRDARAESRRLWIFLCCSP